MSQTLDDPFAFDLFAQPVAPVEPEVAPPPTEEPPARERHWTDALPKCSRAEVEASRRLGSVPTWLFGAMFRAAAPRLLTILRTPPELFGMTSFGWSEVSAAELGQTTDSHRFCATFGVGQPGATLFLQTDASFAAALVERMLGGNGTPPDGLRQVTSAEAAALEFLLLTLAWDVNALLGEPTLRLTSCARWLSFGHFQSAATSDTPTRYLVGTVSLKFAEAVGFAEFILDAATLEAFRQVGSHLLARPVSDPTLALIRQKHVAELARVQPTFSAALVIGLVEATYGELRTLEIGDFVILETIQSVLQPGGIGSVTVGVPETLMLFGELDDEFRLTIQDIVPTLPMLSSEETSMPTEETATPPAVSLDDLAVTVRIELAARRLRLEEVAQLRTGYVLELGCKPTDPVTLTIDGRPIARGELVDVEGRLGVRITQARS
ncbi:type III secretion system cytoplasmic ring protein SctQ [Chloracidobacterium thermophilum]|uniref:Flagellar motor switch protein FliM n=1 Tax=Chloracidobacterium thermophilum (strain B) TaxID=981222 RepID=G2LK47_CHLTF|nr:type III secretion system cytoplasmic ring protein SctQ [Chloracidobacterium thermophilum]AEP13534.1 type III secretion system apparatus protein YscQ/HrcQ [Chloracidobacterium thermophilum B]QUV79992.1 type III secretion system cytoplasmic ring protein SctQ [Chloracidobacterium thermophilum]